MSTAEDFTQLPRAAWDEAVLTKVNEAVVFMDDACAESLHWCGGAARLFEAGARDVKRFSSFEAGGEKEPKAVFVVSTLLRGRAVDVIRDIVSLSRFRCCVVLTAVAHPVHLLAAGGASAESERRVVFEQFEEKLREWMGGSDGAAEVAYAPVVFAPVSRQQLLLAPAYAHLFPLLARDLEAINARRPEKRRLAGLADVDAHALPAQLQLDVKALAAALNSLLEASGAREESFAVGPMSRVIAGELAAHPQAKSRRKTAHNKASLIFVDRTMDLTGARAPQHRIMYIKTFLHNSVKEHVNQMKNSHNRHKYSV